ncbi:MAG: hypothetical protein U0325_25740 [Polyangiales bacterium]
MRHMRAALGALVTIAAAVPARAGNEEGVLFGAHAEMTAGAVTATTHDGCALWYNPAGLAGADTQQLDVSGTAYVFRRTTAPALIQAPGQPSVSAGVTELMSVSASLTYMRRLSDRLTLGFGAFTPRSADQTLRVNSMLPGNVRWLVAAAEMSSEVQAGVGLGWAVHPRVRLGASLFFAYESYTGSTLEQGTLGAGPTPDQFTNSSSLYSYKRGGLEFAVGAQWQPIDALRLGVTIRPPGASVYASETVDVSSSQAIRDGQGVLQSEGSSEVREQSSLEFVQRSPLRVRFGIALEQPRFTLALDGDVSAPLDPTDDADRRWSTYWNLRVGGLVRLSERLRIGAGFFTDRAPDREGSKRPVDFYGGTAGVEWGTLHLLRQERRDRLTFSTSISVRYAYGSGTVDAVQVVPGTLDTVESTSLLEVHEVAIYLGSTFRF